MKGQATAKKTSTTSTRQPAGEFIEFDGEQFYRIGNYDRMPPFFLSVVSAEDHWMFLSSHGGITAGRRDADHALFPYYTDDKLRDHAESSGGKTILRVRRGGKEFLWEPFSARSEGRFRVSRSIAKNICGNRVVLEEHNEDLGLSFLAGWENSRKFGWVRRCRLKNTGRTSLSADFLDGIQNILPSGTGSDFQLRFSTLLDAYKRSELVPGTPLALFRLSAVPADRPEPAEALSTTVAWSVAPGAGQILLSDGQLDAFRAGGKPRPETDVCGRRGAYFLSARATLAPGKETGWMIGADVAQSAADVVRLRTQLKNPAKFERAVRQDIAEGTAELRRIVASADGLQVSSVPMGTARHFGNTLCNVMRGGIFNDGMNVTRDDLDRHVRAAVPSAAGRWARRVRRLPATMTYPEVVQTARRWNDPCLERACREYLPLTFSRRHGDPSRPWNRFTIPSRDAAGRRVLDYEGNWRDIFQNWEALAQSFPGFTAGMIARFLNASTADGYNPYRITRAGIDWEVPEPHDPWACIGYWGDHQIIYLLKLLEHAAQHDPAELEGLLDRDIFAYANVPYRIRPYRSLVADPKDTVVFDQALEKTIQSRARSRGTEGKLLWDKQGRVVRANLAEKLLVPLLAKLSNFVPGAGIWLNTQRPEWNDANNALVGQGTSVVTLAYIRRYLSFLRGMLSASPRKNLVLSADIAGFLRGMASVLEKNRKVLSGAISERDRRKVTEALGHHGEIYREAVYGKGLTAKKVSVPADELRRFLDRALAWTDHSLQLNRRKDGLYHSYNLIAFAGKNRLTVRHLYEMLEGQVAILSSGLLSPRESLALFRALRRSRMYRPDQHSYMLYPNRSLPRFLERNGIPAAEVRRSRLLARLLADDNRDLVEKDHLGQVRFRPGILNGRALGAALDRLAADKTYAPLVRSERARMEGIYEDLFDHQSFTGRSGTFYGYEGLGSIYWHMVSKLLLAAQEIYFRAERENAPASLRRALAAAYYDIRRGLGDAKEPGQYGAFPMDPYSHTPANAGAKQPGLTGQVKEDILCRQGELGIFLEDGQIVLRPSLLRRAELQAAPGRFTFHDVRGKEQTIRLPTDSLAFTFCQTPFVYRLGGGEGVEITLADGSKSEVAARQIDGKTSRAILGRTGGVKQVEVRLDRGKLLGSV
ncbi:MAG: hypothetical protein WD063_14725 [Pirellulales bacterium]